MALLPAVNEKATREAVREFFDSEWPRIVNMADMGYVDLKSVEISDMPSARSFGNANDERFTNHANAVYYYDAVVHAIKVMTQPHRHFMWLRYVRHLEWLQH
ncbi:ArpU family transcriptional regulator [Weissella confusa]|uniref:ArpU family transcriptional regulator n=1 Tax=Weissella confusa TaxID=1583 RepID=UPI001F54E5DF|nr:ArpU family transcriptional regulator [Weissella confusa]UYY91186.1 ArpU family transcriptional regulator [Weissella confusa]